MKMYFDLPNFLFLATCGVPIVLCKGIKCNNAYQEHMCTYGCCGVNGTSENTPCCQGPTDDKTSKPSFTILFFAVIVFTLVLLIVCSVVKCARSDRPRPDRSRPDGIHVHTTAAAGRRPLLYVHPTAKVICGREKLGKKEKPAERVVISSINLILRESENRSRNIETELTDVNTGVLLKGPPTYEEVVKQGPFDLPPSYQEMDYSSSNALRLSRIQNQSSSRLK